MQNLSRKKVILGTKSIAYIGVLIALSSVTNAYSIETGIMSISFNYLIFFVAGYFMGPVAGILVGGLGDVFGCLIKGYPPNPLINACSILLCLIYSLGAVIPLPKKWRPEIKLYIRLVIVFLLGFLTVTTFLNSFATWWYFSSKTKSYLAYVGTRLALQSPVWAINLAITAFVAFPLSKFVFKKSWLDDYKLLLKRNKKEETPIAEITAGERTEVENLVAIEEREVLTPIEENSIDTNSDIEE